MFDKVIIVAQIPFSEMQLVKKAKQLKQLGVKECLLTQCLSSYEEISAMSLHFSDYLNETMEKQVKILTEEGFIVTTKRFIAGNIQAELSKIAHEEGYSMIVVGTEKHTLVGEFLSGGVVYDVIHKAKIPILVLKTDDESDENEPLLKHVLLPTDFSENATLAYEKLKEMLVLGVGKISLITVMKKSWMEPYLNRPMDDFRRLSTVSLEQMKAELADLNFENVDITVTDGTPSQRVLKFIDRKDVSLVVMGTQGRGFVKEIYLGSLSHNLVRHANAAILLIPHKRDEE